MMTASAAELPCEAAAAAVERRVHEVRVRLPSPLLLKIEGLVGSRFVSRPEAIRGLLYEALKGQE
jgi:hypothetical protein